MHHTKRYVLVPEEIYQSLTATSGASQDGSPMGLVRARMDQLKNDDTINEEEKSIRYEQEFKRLNKLKRDEEERPVDVRLQNLREIADAAAPALPTTTASLGGPVVQPAQQQQQQLQAKHKPTSAFRRTMGGRHLQQKQRQRRRLIVNKRGGGGDDDDESAGDEQPKTRVDDDDDDDGEFWEDASPRMLRSAQQTASASTTKSDANYTLTKQGVMALIRRNANALGVSGEGKIKRADGRPLKTSNVERIVAHLLNRDSRSEYKDPPVGLREFTERAQQNAQLSKYLFTRHHLKKKQRLLEFLYKDINSPVSFTSVEPLLRQARKYQQNISRRDVQNFLSTQRTYTLHRQAKRRYRHLPTLAPGLHTEWQADLAIFDRLGKQNTGFRYLLVCIDTLSRQLFVEPVKSKTSASMIKAFDAVFKRAKYVPWKLLTDQGREFTARAVQEHFRAKGIEHFCMFTSPQFHAGMAERANRSIKERLYRYFTERDTYKWVDVVQDFVRAINHSYNSSLGARPVDVNFKNAESFRQMLYDKAKKMVNGVQKFKVGDRVRIEKYKHVFQKGYLPRFTNELFTVAEVHADRSPIVYRLRDDNNETLKGWFYANDLCKTLENKELMYDIERVLRRKKGKDGVEYGFVKWRGYSTRFNSWIPLNSITWKNI
ncbi:hypothetical protein niasHT_033442 [Heterodera trifolii]|uniref:Integrase catalytic domain-containing protein n=1 Tax=Heterodera trifolii TaxID=157864 RepID=A0ABD2HZ65_9BILA